MDEQKLTGDRTVFGFNFPELKPDFSWMSRSAPQDTKPEQLFCLRDAFGMLKVDHTMGPSGARDSTMPEILYQSADYARLHLAARPFNLFSVGLMIAGSTFSAGIFDRDGVAYSPVTHLWSWQDGQLDEAGIRLFIRLIRSLTCLLSDQDIGQDPTVETIDSGDDVNEYPTYRFSLGGKDDRRWQTVGPSCWSSTSYLGRGTSVWTVREYKDGQLIGPELIMKNAWRTSRRMMESAIYRLVEGSHPGLAKFFDGRDVLYPDSDSDTPITVYGLRGYPPNSDGTERYLHRLLLESIGSPLWEYETELELVKALRAAVLGKVSYITVLRIMFFPAL